jgi:hypothetical protein
MSKSAFIAAGLVAASTFLFSQEPSASGVPVQVTVTVEALRGKSVPALNPQDFIAYQERRRLQVTNVVPLQGEHAGLDLLILLDDASASNLANQFGALRDFITAQPPATAIAVGYMRNGTVDTVQKFTADHDRAAQSLRLPLSFFGAMASPYLSLSDSIKHWSDQGPQGNSMRREVVLVSSGVDPLGGTGPIDPYLDSAIDDAQRSGIVVYAIYSPAAGHAGHSVWRMDWGQSHLAQIGEETGGEAYMLGFGAPVSLAPYLTEIAEHLDHQYRVTVLTKPGNKGGFQDIRFVTEAPNAELVSANRIYVPASR